MAENYTSDLLDTLEAAGVDRKKMSPRDLRLARIGQMSIKVAARYWRKSPQTIMRWILDGCPFLLLSPSDYRLKLGDVEKWLQKTARARCREGKLTLLSKAAAAAYAAKKNNARPASSPVGTKYTNEFSLERTKTNVHS